ncbi:MAG: COR domain-containing protein [Crocosphaera sp.]|nr:COR domain-containing protein [Crocosphaera sp.]
MTNNELLNLIKKAKLERSIELSLNNNQISNIPPEIAELEFLKILSLNNNQISNIPPEIAQLNSLQKLSLDNNQISSIPPEIAQLNSLQRLSLSDNQISNIPPEIAQLNSLQILSLSNNPLNPELKSIYEQGLNELKMYLQSQQEKEIILNEVKLIFVGEGEVGKTILLAALRGDDWIKNRQTTHGVEIDIKSLILVDKESSTEITFNGWDFGGQNIYRYTHQMFFTTPAIYLAVWNPRRGPENCRVDEWIKMIKHRTYDEKQEDYQPRILVIATHGGPKERLDHIDEQLLRNEFDDLIVDFHHVDSYTKEGLEILEKKLAKIATEMPIIRRSVPASWKIILDTIREKSQINSWITYEQFQQLCIDQNINLILAKTYLTILNELGYLIYYKHDPILKDTIILKPEWLSKAISFVLESREVKNNFGLVTHEQLSELWNDPKRGEDRYPEPLHPIFRKLMERCDLSYQVELPDADAPPTNLIAQLVPSQRPQHWEDEWVLKSGDKELTEVCRITDVQTGRTEQAEGLIYRLIVRFHPYSLGRQNYDNSCHWKTGMLLDNGFEGRAFIEDIVKD